MKMKRRRMKKRNRSGSISLLFIRIEIMDVGVKIVFMKVWFRNGWIWLYGVMNMNVSLIQVNPQLVPFAFLSLDLQLRLVCRKERVWGNKWGFWIFEGRNFAWFLCHSWMYVLLPWEIFAWKICLRILRMRILKREYPSCLLMKQRNSLPKLEKIIVF